jgi:hypothetical protein
MWLEKGHEPHKRNNWKIVSTVMAQIGAADIWIPESEVQDYFSRRKSHYRNRIERELRREQEPGSEEQAKNEEGLS